MERSGKLLVGIVASVIVGLVAVREAVRFAEQHWDQIFVLLALGIIFGVPVSVAFGKFFLGTGGR